MLSIFFCFPLLLRRVSNILNCVESNLTSKVTTYQDLINAAVLSHCFKSFMGKWWREENTLSWERLFQAHFPPSPPQGKSLSQNWCCVLPFHNFFIWLGACVCIGMYRIDTYVYSEYTEKYTELMALLLYIFQDFLSYLTLCFLGPTHMNTSRSRSSL